MKPHILVVDDSLTVRMDLRGALTAAGFDVTLCETKRSAENLLQQRKFSAAVLDVMLPDGDGVDILLYIRSLTEGGDMPVIMLSSEANVADRVRGLRMGADEYIGKPYNIAYFIRCLRRLCHRERNNMPATVAIVACRRILAVDDSPTFLAHLGRVLREDGHDVVLAHSGPEALDMLAVQTIDCVIVDLMMPGVDGLETIRRIRQIPGRESTPTLMLTASTDPADERQAMEVGTDDFVIKAATLETVRARIRNLLRRKHRDIVALESSQTPAHRQVFPARTHDATPPAASSRARPEMTTPSRIDSSATSRFCPLFLDVASVMSLETERARESLARTLGRLNIDPSHMDRHDLLRALPALREMLTMFFAAEETAERTRALTEFVKRSTQTAM